MILTTPLSSIEDLEERDRMVREQNELVKTITNAIQSNQVITYLEHGKKPAEGKPSKKKSDVDG